MYLDEKKRVKVYKKALKLIKKNENMALCSSLRTAARILFREFSQDGVYLEDIFIELRYVRPKGTTRWGFWWPLYDRDIRIHTLYDMIDRAEGRANREEREKMYRIALQLIGDREHKTICSALLEAYNQVNNTSYTLTNTSPETFVHWFPEFEQVRPWFKNYGVPWWDVNNTEKRIEKLKKMIQLTQI